MRILLCMIALFALASAARAQLRLPALPALPTLPAQRLTQTLNQSGNTPLAELSEVRRVSIARLIRANPRTIAADPHGNPIVRDELLALSPSDSALQTALAAGFMVVREQALADFDGRLVILAPPPHLNIVNALARLQRLDPSGIYDFNHIYTGSGSAARADSAPAAVSRSAPLGDEGAGARVRVGLIDAGVDGTHPAFRNALIHPWGCGANAVPSAHGTAVAALLLGQSGSSRSALRQAELFTADVYCGAPSGGAVDTLIAAFAWFVHERVAVVNLSLVGPDNAALAQMVRDLSARGHVLIAAVGNDGPASPPLYPAAYPQVVGVTAVDAQRRVLLEAVRGPQVMFAAPGADLNVPTTGGSYARVRGTSFAAPIVAGILAEAMSAPDPRVREAALQAMAAQAIDLGTPGRDLTYGFGLVGADKF